MPSIIETIGNYAGPQRNKTFMEAAGFVLSLAGTLPLLIETGCYRGAACDGNSTLIMALLARETGGKFFSFDISPQHIHEAHDLLVQQGIASYATFIEGDSARTLRTVEANITLAYLDSYDFEPSTPINAQAHQMIEAGLVLPKMAKVSAFLLDDCDLPHGGKAGLSLSAIQACGYKVVAEGYQKLLIRQ
jgi:hypothetical protein